MINRKIFVGMDGVLVNFQSGIDKLDETIGRILIPSMWRTGGMKQI